MTLSQRVATIESKRMGKTPIPAWLMALALKLCEGETADL